MWLNPELPNPEIQISFRSMRRTENDWMRGISKYVSNFCLLRSPLKYSPGQPHYFQQTAAGKPSWTGEAIPCTSSQHQMVLCTSPHSEIHPSEAILKTKTCSSSRRHLNGHFFDIQGIYKGKFPKLDFGP